MNSEHLYVQQLKLCKSEKVEYVLEILKIFYRSIEFIHEQEKVI
jgi:hypothetical protein